jgi:hypothetical protein
MGWQRKNLIKMMKKMGMVFSEDISTRELKRLYRHAPNKNFVGQGKERCKKQKSTDIFDRGRRMPGNYKG